MNGLGRRTLMLDWCWVCNTRFQTSKPPGPANREDHHIFPRNAGGTDGPLVSLCDTHHSRCHKIASRMHGKKPFQDLLVGETDSPMRTKLMWLAAMIVKAESEFGEDPNKRLVNSVSLHQDDIRMLEHLQKSVFPGKSRQDLLRAGIALLFKTYAKSPKS